MATVSTDISILFHLLSAHSKRSAPDMFSFLTSDLRPDPPVIDQVALEAAILHAETQGSNA